MNDADIELLRKTAADHDIDPDLVVELCRRCEAIWDKLPWEERGQAMNQVIVKVIDKMAAKKENGDGR